MLQYKEVNKYYFIIFDTTVYLYVGIVEYPIGTYVL